MKSPPFNNSITIESRTGWSIAYKAITALTIIGIGWGCKEPPLIGSVHIPSTVVVDGQCSMPVKPASSSPELVIEWFASKGSISAPNDSTVIFQAPPDEGDIRIEVVVSEGQRRDSRTAVLSVSATAASSAPRTKGRARAAQRDAGLNTIAGRFELRQVANPTGRMGDATSVRDDGTKTLLREENCTIKPPRGTMLCERWSWSPGKLNWVSVAFQHPDQNFEKYPGLDLSQQPFEEVIFWARGQRGGEAIKFEVGCKPGSGKPHPASMYATKRAVLTSEWTQYRISLEGLDLSNIPHVFGWSATTSTNPDGITFYLGEVQFR